MTIFPIRKYGDPVLRQVLPDADPTDDSLRALIQNMADTMYDAPGLGLAANQIGVMKRVFVYDEGEGEGLQTYLNPEIIEGEGEVEDDEGCLSVASIQMPVKRFERIKVRMYTPDGEEKIIEAEGMLARILQHEIDHLDGKTIIDRLPNDLRRRIIQEFNEKEGFL